MNSKTLINTESQGQYFDNFSRCNYLKNSPDDSPILIVQNKKILNHMFTDHYDYLTEKKAERRSMFFKYVARTCLILLIAFIISLFFSCAPVRTVPQTWVCKEVYKVPGGMYVHKFVSLTGTKGYDEIFNTVLFSENDTMKCYFVGNKIYIIK
jgi:hypothetical protein